jgi:mannitol-1-phosphate 5-dehydrogenase
MNLNGELTYTGFGLGAIQAGLFLYEAMSSGRFGRLVVAEVLPELVRHVRENKGYLSINIAHADHIQTMPVGPIEVYDPAVEADREKLIEAISCSHEIGTAVPAVRLYSAPGPESLSCILAGGLQAKVRRHGPPAVLYAAENHNRAAEILEASVLAEVPTRDQEKIHCSIQFLNTVIGKMSGVVIGQPEIDSLGLTPMTPGSNRAYLVEAFNRILISRSSFPEVCQAPGFKRGITTFIEKDDLLPFEEAKLFGHNATHALAAYLGQVLGIHRIAEVPSVPGLLEFLRRAFIEESGKALIHRYRGIDPLFTPQGYAAYADDLLRRMINPWLTDTADRVGRDVERKLGWDDRLVGTIRLGLSAGITPRRYALGAAAALLRLDPGLITNRSDPVKRLPALWGDTPRDNAQEIRVMELIREAFDALRHWQDESLRDPRALLAEG